jgi:glycosyltransferase involved in cell wall biosynthesis
VVVDLILPVLNEAPAIPWVLDRVPTGWGAIVVDNGSTDGSAAVADALGAQVVLEPRRGFGAACWAGLLAATADVVCFMDCDGTLDPRDAPRLTELVERAMADLVLGRREAEPGAWPWHASMVNRFLARGVSLRAGVSLRDLGPLRAVGRRDLMDLGVEDRGFGWPLEMALRAAIAGWRIEEVPVPYRRRVGRSKVTGTLPGTLRAARDMAVVGRRLSQEHSRGALATRSRAARGAGGRSR